MREKIIELFNQALDLTDKTLKNDLTDETILLESGLDSLGFAILIALLEEKFGYDPFILMDQPVYPKTFSEFVAIYKKYYCSVD